ncbi:MAG TPA: 2TM domain-containing protein [Pricia antarctica]|uniref:2TM domain-containing protein n=2 Tax=root TaxID=1 RepID=A0A831QPB9_9FLAO|nr:2TM domain-containing protein [Pricia antarctica]
MESNRKDKQIKARQRVAQLKGFYVHLTVFVIINLFIITTSMVARINNGENFMEALFTFGTFSTAFFWGIGLAFHAAKTFAYNPFFSKDWEERQIQKYIEEDKREAEKFGGR